MSQGITPYDTGERLEPHPWVKVRGQVATPMRWCADAATPPEAEDFGRVDFDDEEGRTVLTLYVTHSPGGPDGPSGYELHVENLIGSLTVTGGTEAAVLSLEHPPALRSWSAWPSVAGRTSSTKPATATTPSRTRPTLPTAGSPPTPFATATTNPELGYPNSTVSAAPGGPERTPRCTQSSSTAWPT